MNNQKQALTEQDVTELSYCRRTDKPEETVVFYECLSCQKLRSP